MKTPSKKEVKAYFKNAKEVKTHYGNIITYTEAVKGHILNTFMDKSVNVTLWDKEKGYAEIISYIKPTTEVRNSVLLQLADNNSFSEKLIKKEFPQLFLPTDIITIVEKYGKDKVISLIEKM